MSSFSKRCAKRVEIWEIDIDARTRVFVREGYIEGQGSPRHLVLHDSESQQLNQFRSFEGPIIAFSKISLSDS